jgi:hypothetical protein
MSDAEVNIHLLDTGASVTSLSPHASPFEEYQAAFTDRDQAFFEYYSLHGKSIETQVLTRGEFWDLSCTAFLAIVYMMPCSASPRSCWDVLP